MANTKVYVNTDSSGGTDGSTNASGVAFPSLNAALVYVGANKVAGDIWTVICSAPSGVADNYSGTFNTDNYSILTNSTGYLHIRPNRGNEGGTVANQRHGGVWDTSKYLFSQTTGFLLNLADVRITGLQILCKGSGTTPPSGPRFSGNNNKVERCIIRHDPAYAGDGSANINVGIHTTGSPTGCIATNCFVLGFNLSTAYTPGRGLTCGSPKFINNTVISCRRGATWTAVGTVRNNLIHGSVTDDFESGTWNYSTVTNCASEDATAPGTSNRINQTFTFNNAGALDYRITSSDSGARTFGVDASADDWTDVDTNPNGPSVTIDDVVRSGTWSIGASEAVASAVGVGSSLIRGRLAVNSHLMEGLVS